MKVARCIQHGVLLITLILGLVVGGSVALAVHNAGDSSGTLGIEPPWGPADQDPAHPQRVEVTYVVKAGSKVPASTVQAVNEAIAAWNAGIDAREAAAGNAWDFDLVPKPKGVKGADIEIQIKSGGGRIAGSALSSFSGGFRVKVRIQISGSSFGQPNADATVKEITLHELGHALGLGHHSNENDLLGPTVGHTDGSAITTISSCDLDGFEESHHWLTKDQAGSPHPNHVTSITCL